ncbi:hypothetical protein PC9H_007467 [Pleurotus ostreatus]|uniref:Zn(2)-C6 fungal-type domain-containing protein n=1 Tax=Pleurotus ostreatus TaxID=5322 RepID=A0A8H6ZTZ6_PLEOS|nr:uncharacterized protein PC9H_007467 [Pleurotus ostreatus]KAF7428246.1 hypothetical protein PC9H_007467 [Pleurotus ostreatus]
MSSETNEISTFGPLPGSKRRRLQGACDTCRHKKIKCDSALMPGNRCSHCIAFNSECTHNLSKKRNSEPSTPAQSYVESLEQRVKKLEHMLQKLDPESSAGTSDANRVFTEPSESVMIAGCGTEAILSAMSPSPASTSHNSPANANADDADDVHALADELKDLHILPDSRFFGKSSSFVLLRTAIGVKQEYAESAPSLGTEDFSKRPEYWRSPPLEQLDKLPPIQFQFPEQDLLDALVDKYFVIINLVIPLLHKPTFEAQLAAKLHTRDQWFGSVVLAICAVASRYLDDPRCLDEGDPAALSTGWKWFSQIRTMRQSFVEAPSLYELQFYSLATLYYQGTSNPQACWIMVGLGLRYAQEVGAHRKTARVVKPTLQDELWKRAFWVLVIMDKLVSAFVGRPCALHEEDYDVGYPLEVDDEYWCNPDPELAFKQPPGKMSKITTFNLLLKLGEILAVALRVLYSANKSKLWTGLMGPNWEYRMVAELDSELNSWLDSVPDNLRWNPRCEDRDTCALSANLFCTYYYTQILVHRPFISGSLHASGLSFPSLAICVNAARSCAHLLDAYISLGFLTAAPTCQMVAFTSGIILLINIWGAKKSRISFRADKEMADVRKLMHVLQTHGTRWRVSGKLWDVLNTLASMEDLPLPELNIRSNKRSPPSDDSSGSNVEKDTNFAVYSDLLHHSPSTSTLSSAGSPSDLLATPSGILQPPTDILPLTTDELGRLPVVSNYSQPWTSTNTSGFTGQPSLDGTSAPLSTQPQQTYQYSQKIPVGYLGPQQGSQYASNTISGLLQSQEPVNPFYTGGDATMDLWSAVPGGFDLDEWGGYLANFDPDVFA